MRQGHLARQHCRSSRWWCHLVLRSRWRAVLIWGTSSRHHTRCSFRTSCGLVMSFQWPRCLFQCQDPKQACSPWWSRRLWWRPVRRCSQTPSRPRSPSMCRQESKQVWQWCEDLQAVAAPSALPASPALPLPSHLVASTPTSIAAPVPQAQPVAPASVAAQTAVAPAATMAAPGQAAPNAPILQAPAAVGQAIGAAAVSAPAATTPATPARAAPAAVTETTAEHGATVGLESEQAKSSMAMLNALKSLQTVA